MKNNLLTGGAILAFATAAFAATPALADGTQAGTTITNTVNVNYNVGGVAQNQQTATNSVVVDRKINLTVARVDNVATAVVPGSNQQAVFFRVTNTSNDTLDFALNAVNVVNGQAAGITGTDSFDTTGGFTYYLEDATPGFQGTETQINNLDALGIDQGATVIVVSNIPAGLASNSIAAVTLTATAAVSNGIAGTTGAVYTTQSTTNTAGIDTIFADTGRDAKESATDDYIVQTADIAVVKSSKVVASPVTGDISLTNIPLATVEYCILVTNNSPSVSASGVTISDDISALNLTFVTANLPGRTFPVAVGGDSCTNYGTTAGSQSNGVITGNIGTVGTTAATRTRSVIFRALIK